MDHPIIPLLAAPAALMLVTLLSVQAGFGATDGNEKIYTVRIVTISAPELAASRVAMMTAPPGDDALFAQMTELVASGGGEVAGDTIMRGGPGKWSASANDEIPYPTEFDVDQKWRQVIPTSFTFRNAGVSVEAAIDEGADGRPPRLNFSWQRTRSTEGRIFPVITVKTFTQVEQPGFLTDKITGSITVAGRQWRLAGMTRRITTQVASATPPRALLTFVKVWGGNPPKGVAPAASMEERLHLFVFRVPMAEGMAIAMRSAGTDETLLDSLLDRVETGEIQLANHAACLLPPIPASKTANDGESPADADPFAGPSARDSGAANAEGIHEYAYATEFEPDPSSFSFRNLGHSFTVSSEASDGAGSGSVTLKWEAQDDPVKLLPLTPQPEGATMTDPEFSTEALECRAVATPGSVRMVGAVLRPDDGGPRMMHVFFVKNAGPAMESGNAAMNHTEVHAALVSLSADDGARLAARGNKKKWEDLEPLMKSGAARILAWQGVAGKKGTAASVKRFTETPVATKAAMYPADGGGLVYGTHSTFYTLGDSMELKLPANSGAAFDGKFSVNLEKPDLPALTTLLAAAKDGTKLPHFMRTETVFPAPGDTGPPVKYNQPQIVSLAPCTAREGHPEHGRWHAVVLIIRES